MLSSVLGFPGSWSKSVIVLNVMTTILISFLLAVNVKTDGFMKHLILSTLPWSHVADAIAVRAWSLKPWPISMALWSHR